MLPVAAAFSQQKQVDQETEKRVARDALIVETPAWTIGDATSDVLEWHDALVNEGTYQ